MGLYVTQPTESPVQYAVLFWSPEPAQSVFFTQLVLVHGHEKNTSGIAR